MDINKAYSILNVSKDISEDELKIKYKELAKKYHPDIYKEDPDKFKQINEAYQFIKNYKENPMENIPFGFNDIFNSFRQAADRQSRRNVDFIRMNKEITFEESVIGVEIEIEFDREMKCNDCDGEGFRRKNNKCPECDGFGRSVIRQGNTVFSSPCNKCNGTDTKVDCVPCDKKSFVINKSKMKVKIPAGVQDGNAIQLQGAGHFIQSSVFGDSYSSVLIKINVKNNTDLKVVGKDVIYNLSLSLLEAIQGCSKTVPSIMGNKEINVPPKSKNKEEVVIENLGVGLVGVERVVLNIDYPENIDKLISVLKE